MIVPIRHVVGLGVGVQGKTAKAANEIAAHCVGVGVQGPCCGTVAATRSVHNVAVALGVSVGVGVQSTNANGNFTAHSVGVGVIVGVQVTIGLLAILAVIGP